MAVAQLPPPITPNVGFIAAKCRNYAILLAEDSVNKNALNLENSHFWTVWSTLIIIFNVAGLALLVQFLRFKINDYTRLKDKAEFWTISRHRYTFTVLSLLAASYVIIELLPGNSVFANEVKRYNLNIWFGVIVSFLISVNWAIYLRKLDVFEPERWVHIFIVFLMGSVTVWGVFPLAGILNKQFAFDLNGDAINDFFYCTIGIGMVEEFVKFIPLFIIIRFKKIVNEPFDYVLYASVAALGFAFIENSLYIQRSDLYAINGRALMSTVAHMTFSSVVGYSYMISVCKLNGKGWYYVLGGFLLASIMHGFYDFWLINPVGQKYSGLSYVFFLMTVHFWFTLKSKAINASYFFDEALHFSNSKVRYYLVLSLVSLVAISAFLIGLFHGKEAAHKFLGGQIFSYAFLIYYLVFSFSKFRLAPKALAACQVVFEKTIPKEPDPIDNWEAFHQEKHW